VAGFHGGRVMILHGGLGMIGMYGGGSLRMQSLFWMCWDQRDGRGNEN